MKSITLNQIILLLDIHRGTNTQHLIETNRKDIHILLDEDLIDFNTKLKEYNSSIKGKLVIIAIVNQVIIQLR